jgi:hypothetical protein
MPSPPPAGGTPDLTRELDEAERIVMGAKRTYSESRLRQKLVGVRMSPAEHELLAAEAKRTGRSEASVLRDSFLAALPAAAVRVEWGLRRSLDPEDVCVWGHDAEAEKVTRMAAPDYERIGIANPLACRTVVTGPWVNVTVETPGAG